ncbi:hypothetical protein BDV96DRAFT_244394 [Lophiotrema nucula]|uniref:Uncharacterized protein n=1 Tax=Lophiotrema nucula TaxID=690887 RepID=A0A6A5YQC9_9PLEO|nr:hypothetical protein BDV96DRAFT_244394 [Lophiotrema nucula]
MMRPFIQLRQAQNSFDPNSYYTFHNDVYPKNTISAGVEQSSNGVINMTQEQSFSSSENWQLYYQQGRYFIRNYDYGAGYQLGLDKASLSVPRLMQSSGELGQQWTLAKADGGLWKVTNGLLGNDTALGLSGHNTVPGMQPSEDGTSWSISLNPSAGAPQDKAMLKDVANFEVVPSSSSSKAVPSATSTSISFSTTSESATPTHSSITASASSSSASASKGTSVSPGAIAGIVVGAVLLLVVLGLVTYHFLSRRKQRKEVTELGGLAVQPPSEKYAQAHVQHPVELG